MQFDILTLFPGLLDGPFSESIIKKAQERGLIVLNTHNIRDKATDKHKTADDSPFGGGPGMVMLASPIIEHIKQLKKTNPQLNKIKYFFFNYY